MREKITDYIFTDQFPPEKTEEFINIEPLKIINKKKKEIRQYEGLYWDRIGDLLFNIHLHGDSLFADDYLLLPEAENLFRIKNGENITGSKIFFHKKEGALNWQMVFTRGKDVSFKSDNSFQYEWVDSVKSKVSDEFTGLFYSDELDQVFEITDNADHLEMNIRGYDEPVKILPVFKDYFSDPDFAGIYFQRNHEKKISGFIFMNAKANNILFKKISLSK